MRQTRIDNLFILIRRGTSKRIPHVWIIIWCLHTVMQTSVCKIPSVALHISGTIHHIIVICGTHLQNDNISRCFLHFFKNVILVIVSGVKEQKMTQNEKKFCPSRSIFQVPYTIWLSFIVHMCKISSIFQNFGFPGRQGAVKGQKMGQNDKKFCLSCLIFQESYIM